MDKSTYLAAWIGAATGVCSLAWNVYLKVTAGPKLKILAMAGMVEMPPRARDLRYLRITVQNIGTAPTTITNYSFHSFKNWRSKFKKNERTADKSALLNQYSGSSVPRS